ncbi:MAG: glycoside hydrolase family protein [Polyangiaceae bacterium]|nr:glycoside hydrolase family protein [Polyangiaceae bacterium]
MPIINQLTSDGWGASNVQPRDQDNGLEDKTNKSWSYWDGRIIKAADGKSHLFASRWSQSAGHNGWFGSSCVHAVSDSNILGPYVDKGLCYDDANGQGHNVMASQLPDGRYFILVSETRRPAVIYTSTSLDGPWNKEGTITTEANGFNVDASSGGNLHSNTSMWVRSDGSILATSRDGVIMLSTNGILGPYKVQGTSVYDRSISYTPGGTPEDPCLWYSGGRYHMIYSYPLDRKAYHLASVDGIKDWKNEGLAYDATKPFIKYTDGTTNIWNKIERPQVYLEDGHVKYFSFAVIDVDKGNDGGNDSHSSKVIVVPFDGTKFDADTGVGGGDTGGTGGTGGTSGSGGTTIGGGTASGGTATGGTSVAGGRSGRGGGAGGRTATGGGSSTGGVEATGGSSAAGGAPPSGGSTVMGGTAPTTGGTTPGGGAGGSTGGVVTATGGTVSPSGGTASGGGTSATSVPGSTASGGVPASGGAAAPGGGTSAPDVDAGPNGTDASSDEAGCGCRVAAGRSNSLAVFGVLGLLALGLPRRRPRIVRTSPELERLASP